MRILSLGCSLPDSQIDNYDWGSAPSFFDYDAIIVDPAMAVSELIEGILRKGAAQLTYSDEPIEDGPSTAFALGLADLLRQRQEETERLLAKGGLVVCFAYPDVAHSRVSGFTGAHRYYWLPAPPGHGYDATHMRPAHGTSLSVTDYAHPFADYLEGLRGSVLYRAIFAEGPDRLGAGARVIARSPGGGAIALDLPVAGGCVVFLPALPPRLSVGDRSGIASKLVTAIRDTLLISAEERPPEWLASYALPGIEGAQRRIDEAEIRLEMLEAELDEARSDYRSIDRYRRLLWQEGKYGFDLPVRDALSLLGFTTFSRTDDPASFSYDGEPVLVETESSPGVVGMQPHYRLRQRLEERIAAEGKRPRGLIVISGYRDTPPGERQVQYEESLRVAAESMRYCVLQAVDLYEAVRDKLEGTGDQAAFCRQLLETEGVATFEWPPREEARDASELAADVAETEATSQ